MDLKKELSNEINKSKDLLREKGMYFNVVYNSDVTHDITVMNLSYIRSDIQREIILQGLENGNNLRNFIKELVEKFS